jgi:hypothetical protein
MPRNAIAALLVALLAGGAAGAAAGQGRERALEQIPELMGRILESQAEIREREAELEPVVAGHEVELADARRDIERADGEQAAAEAVVRYVEAYAARLEAQQGGLRSIEHAVVRMRTDARELVRAAEAVRGDGRPSAGERRTFLANQFQGLAAGTAELAARLDREPEAAAAGSVLHASWASQGALDLALPELLLPEGASSRLGGLDGATAFARKADALYARYQARASQLRAERRAVRRLLDLLIERQLGDRLDALFADGDPGLGALLASGGRSEEWNELGSAVGRALGLSSPSDEGLADDTGSLDRLDRFARGEHREQEGTR